MLDNLTNTKLKKRLLGVLFRFPQRSFSPGELREYTGGSRTAINTTLKAFLNQDAVTMATRKKRLFFRINPRFVLRDELKDLVTGFIDVREDWISKKLKILSGAKLIVLSGVFTHEPQLPSDLLLVGENINRTRLARLVGEIETLLGVEVNYTVMDRAEFNHRRNVSDRFLRDLLDYPHIVVVDSLRLRH